MRLDKYLKVSRLIVTDHAGLTIYDSLFPAARQYALLPEIIQALAGNDVFYGYYHDGAMQSHAATPIISYQTTIGCVYMMEYDTAQGSLIQSLQGTVLRITLMLEFLVILFSMTFATTFSRRLRRIMNSMHIIPQGD